jgi:hypothetical protein
MCSQACRRAGSRHRCAGDRYLRSVGADPCRTRVIILLQAKVPLELIQKFLPSRGVNFVSTKETSKRVLASGGNVALVGTINLNQKDEVIPLAANGGKDKDKKK